MLKSDRIWGYVDLKEKVLGIDAGQNAAAERFLLRLRSPFDQILINPLQFNDPVSGLLSKIFFGNAPSQFAVGRECRMQDAADAGSIVRWTEFDLSDKTIRDHVANGMRLTHLAIVYDNIMSFVLDENGVITKLKFLGMDDAPDDENEPLARLDAEFVMLTGSLRALLKDLKSNLT